MALARTDGFPDKDVQLAEWCKALTHPARIIILRTLASRGECICGELVVDLPLSQASVSQHLKALKEVGLIRGEIEGPRSKYCVNKTNFERLVAALGKFAANVIEDLNDDACR
ncbi:MAG: helix-turn-helix transcriptional regulator [Bdellovibrionales bacterium]|nr:helix-turn-helix transcriptional regulator [Bdellovibrionales bacterium]